MSGLSEREICGIPLVHLLTIAVFFLLTRVPFLSYLPFVQDEALYAIMTVEQQDNPTPVPTFLGYPVSWKMAPFFWANSFLSGLVPFIGLEARYRLLSFLCGFVVPLLLYLAIRRLSSGNAALLSCLLYLSTFISIYPDDAILFDTPGMLFVVASIFFYASDSLGSRRFILAGLCASLAFLFKLVVAFLPGLLFLLFFLLTRRNQLSDPIFILSLLMPLAPAVINYSLLSPFGGGEELYLSDIPSHIFGKWVSGTERFLSSANTLLYSAAPVFLASLYGLLRRHKDHPFMALWYAFIIFPLLSATDIPWHYLPALPAVSFFAVAGLSDRQWNVSRTGIVVIIAIIAVSLLMSSNIYKAYSAAFLPQRDAGLYLAGKENVLIIGEYRMGTVAYKILAEKETGRIYDFGLIIGPPGFGPAAAKLVRDYRTDEVTVVDGSFSRMFTSSGIFRKNTSLESFRYVAVTGNIGLEPSAPVEALKFGDITVYDFGNISDSGKTS
ncbi:MAG: glycosyltransferase family 39 protein [Candidatus Micrarchaeota archaeon]